MTTIQRKALLEAARICDEKCVLDALHESEAKACATAIRHVVANAKPS